MTSRRDALAFWRERERTFPAFVRRDPDALDLASGAWAACVAEAADKRTERRKSPDGEAVGHAAAQTRPRR